MDTMLIQLTNQKAVGLLHELEELHIIKVLKESIADKPKLSDKYEGILSSNIAEELQKHLAESRNEWSKRII